MSDKEEPVELVLKDYPFKPVGDRISFPFELPKPSAIAVHFSGTSPEKKPDMTFYQIPKRWSWLPWFLKRIFFKPAAKLKGVSFQSVGEIKLDGTVENPQLMSIDVVFNYDEKKGTP